MLFWLKNRTERVTIGDGYYMLSRPVAARPSVLGRCLFVLEVCRRASGPHIELSDTMVGRRLIKETDRMVLTLGIYRLFRSHHPDWPFKIADKSHWHNLRTPTPYECHWAQAVSWTWERILHNVQTFEHIVAPMNHKLGKGQASNFGVMELTEIQTLKALQHVLLSSQIFALPIRMDGTRSTPTSVTSRGPFYSTSTSYDRQSRHGIDYILYTRLTRYII